MLSSLNPALLRLIAQVFSRRSDLAHISATSKLFSEVIRPLLYQNVVLNTSLPSSKDTFALLCRDDLLARNCTRIKIIAQNDALDISDETFFVNLLNLQAIEIDGCPFVSEEAVQSFERAASQYWRKLEVLELRWSQDRHPSPYTTSPLALKGLKHIVWEQRGVFLLQSFMSLVEASCDTLEHLSISGNFDDFGCEASLPFFLLRFPNLRTFHIGTAIDPSEVTVDEPLTRFLLAHPTLEDVAIGWESDDEWQTEISEEPIQPTMLPALRKLRTNVNNMARLLRRGVSSLDTSLRELVVGHGLNAYAEDDFEAFRRAVDSSGGMLALESLTFIPGESMSDHYEELVSVIKTIGLRCPSIKLFNEAAYTQDGYTSILSSFPNLVEAELPDAAFSRIQQEAQQIARACPHLEKITTFRGEVPKRGISIQRLPDASISTASYRVMNAVSGNIRAGYV